MIRMTRDGTVYITADAFCDRYNFMPKDRPFVYATGDFPRATEQDARELQKLISKMVGNGSLAVDEREKGGAGPRE